MSEKRFTAKGLVEGVPSIWCDDEDMEQEDVAQLLNELYEENEQLKQQLKTKHIVNKQYEELQRLKKENERLLKQVEDCKDYNAILYRNCVQKDKRWLKRVEKLDEELEEYIKENARLRELVDDD